MVSGIFMSYSAYQINSLSEELCADPDNCQLRKEKITGAVSTESN